MQVALDPRFVPASALQEYFVDKTTGAPLAAGIVTFYNDENRTVLKDIYKISGVPPNYTYETIPNPMTLTSVGTASDGSGNDIMPYLFPYEGTPDDSDGTVELYYITVESSGLTPQWTREGWPNVGASSASSELGENFVPNSQFLFHNDIPATNTNIAGVIVNNVTDIAQGGWTYERSGGTGATDLVTFTDFGNYVTNPAGSPRFACRVQSTTAGTGYTEKYLAVKWLDVNKFASTSQYYTAAFSAISNAGEINVSLILVKYFGAGGSATTFHTLQTFTLTDTYTIYSIPFIFGDNAGKTIGTGGDDYVQLALSLPLGSTFDASFTDDLLLLENVTPTGFPPITNAMMLSEGIAGWMPTPDPDGSDLYLPLVLTKAGLTFSDSQVGKIYGSTDGTVAIDELSADGTGYQTNLVNTTSGIPYSRIQAKYWNAATQTSRYGTGPTFVMSYISGGNTAQLYLTTNAAGPVTATADGSVLTNFAFANVHTGNSPTFGVRTATSTGFLWLITSGLGVFAATTGAGTSTFSYNAYKNTDAGGYSFVAFGTAAAAALAGLYFQFNVTAQKYVWFKVDTVGIDPAPGGTGIEVDLKSTDIAQDVVMKICSACAGYQSSTIICGAASTFSGGAYFSFNTLTQLYVVWYKKDGTGTRPVVANALYLEVDVVTGDTAAQVASKTQAVINAYYVAVPDARGLFLRGYDPTFNWNANYALSFSGVNYTNYGSNLGTLEIDEFYQHTHSQTQNTTQGGVAVAVAGSVTVQGGTGANFTPAEVSTTAVSGANWAVSAIGLTGQEETRPMNMSVLWVVKY